MTKAEAIKALEEGKTITHEYFTNDEFIKRLDANYYEDENGYHLLKSEFWSYRLGEAFNNGWSIVEGK
jgi:hypothetical protein